MQIVYNIAVSMDVSCLNWRYFTPILHNVIFFVRVKLSIRLFKCLRSVLALKTDQICVGLSSEITLKIIIIAIII